MSHQSLNSKSSDSSQDSLELVLNQLEFTYKFDEFKPTTQDKSSSRVGDGAFSSVYKYTHEKLGAVVIKEIRIRNNDHGLLKSRFESFCQEVKVLQHLSHENIVQCYGITHVCEDVVGIIMEYVDGTSLQCLLKKQGIKLPWIIRFSILYQIAKILNQLHKYKKNKWLVHCDLKSQNIMITDDWKVKLIDFGSINFGKIAAASEDSLDEIKSDQKTETYAAPELMVYGIDDIKRVPAMDMYSYGMVIYEVITGKAVYSDANCSLHFVLEAIKNGVRPNSEHLDEMRNLLKFKNRNDEYVIFVNLRSLAEACWKQDPRSRPTVDEVIQSLEEIFLKVAGIRINDSQLKTRVEQAGISMELEGIIKCSEKEENLVEENLADLIRRISSQSALDSRVYDVIDDVAILFIDRAIHSKSLQDVQKAFDLWSSAPDAKKVNLGLKRCKERFKASDASNTEFTLRVDSLTQTAQKAVDNRLINSMSPRSVDKFTCREDQSTTSGSAPNFDVKDQEKEALSSARKEEIEMYDEEVEMYDEESDTLASSYATLVCPSAASKSTLRFIYEEVQLEDEDASENRRSNSRVVSPDLQPIQDLRPNLLGILFIIIKGILWFGLASLILFVHLCCLYLGAVLVQLAGDNLLNGYMPVASIIIFFSGIGYVWLPFLSLYFHFHFLMWCTLYIFVHMRSKPYLELYSSRRLVSPPLNRNNLSS